MIPMRVKKRRGSPGTSGQNEEKGPPLPALSSRGGEGGTLLPSRFWGSMRGGPVRGNLSGLEFFGAVTQVSSFLATLVITHILPCEQLARLVAFGLKPRRGWPVYSNAPISRKTKPRRGDLSKAIDPATPGP